ncbi:hypothetical protein G6K93_23410 [Agrobacterium rhizogenes]|nr:hypothetical protein [Rhizobium rhizogenes]NTH66823.1 hypothetical protein [Rhizobium rhizogenes]NTJ49959.1 hypothetical protein [Rhizobium rhizogenes]
MAPCAGGNHVQAACERQEPARYFEEHCIACGKSSVLAAACRFRQQPAPWNYAATASPAARKDGFAVMAAGTRAIFPVQASPSPRDNEPQAATRYRHQRDEFRSDNDAHPQ